MAKKKKKPVGNGGEKMSKQSKRQLSESGSDSDWVCSHYAFVAEANSFIGFDFHSIRVLTRRRKDQTVKDERRNEQKR